MKWECKNCGSEKLPWICLEYSTRATHQDNVDIDSDDIEVRFDYDHLMNKYYSYAECCNCGAKYKCYIFDNGSCEIDNVEVL